MKMRYAILLACLLLLVSLPSFSMLKQQYGGNIKVAEELLNDIQTMRLFDSNENQIVSLVPFPLSQEDNSLSIDLKSLDPDQITEIEKWTLALQDQSSSCHWILDYPYFDHQHPTTITVEGNRLVVKTTDVEFRDTMVQSGCLLPPDLTSLRPFNKTQFGYEANTKCSSGRPFLDGITPVGIDPVNPYLSLKLNDVDVTPVPEERFNQINNDPDVSLIAGPKFYIYFVISGLSQQQVQKLLAVIDPGELAKAVLNDHAEIIFSRQENAAAVNLPAISFSYPQENPYRLLAERLRIQWENAGVSFLNSASGGQRASVPTMAASGGRPPKSWDPSIRFAVRQIHENSLDIFRYNLLRTEFNARGSVAWFDQWDQMESSGQLIPLMIHLSRVAFRKSIQDLHTSRNGLPDFANCWLLQ